MAEAARMPTDEQTGLPHVLLPIDYSRALAFDGTINYHHHFYNRRHPDLEGSLKVTQAVLLHPERIPLEKLAGLAVRMSRGQRLPMNIHQLAHQMYPLGPELPHTLDEKFMTVAKACSGLVSRWAIDLTAPDSDKFVYMRDDLFHKVTSAQLLCTERSYADGPADPRRRVIGSFLLRYAAAQDLSPIISQSVIDQFLNPRSEDERVMKGNFILKEATRASVQPVAAQFLEFRGSGMVQPGKTDVLRSVRKYLHPHSWAAVRRELAVRLAA